MAFDPTAIPVGQQFAYQTTITQAENYLYVLVLRSIMARDLDNVYEVLTDGWYLSNSLYALNDPNISSINYQKIILGINAVCKPFNDQVYPKLTL